MIRIAIIGTGGMGEHHARVFHVLAGCTLVAACGPDKSRVSEFSSTFGISGVYTSLGQLLNQIEVDALVIAAPDPVHADLSLQGIAAGKHIFCEKPLAQDYAQAREMTRAAQRAGIVNMVNFSYRQSAALQRARKLVRDGKLGRIIHVEGSHLQSWLSSKAWGDWRTDPAWLRRLSTKSGSQGVLGDLSGHLFDFVSYVVGDFESVQCRLRTFDKSIDLTEHRQIKGDEFDANDSAVLTAGFSNGALGTLHMSRWATGQTNRIFLSVHGDKGALRINLEGGDDTLDVCLGSDVDKAGWKTLTQEPLPGNQQRFVDAIQTGEPVQPDFARGAAIQRVIDACFASALDGQLRKV